MRKLEIYILLWVVYLISLLLMWFDFYYSLRIHKLNKYLFYLLANGTLILRVIGVFWFIIVLHAFIPFFMLFVIIYNHPLDMVDTLTVFLWLPLACQIGLACLLFFMRYSGRAEDKDFYAGVHAHIGILIVFVYFWNVCFLQKQSAWCGITSVSYMLAFVIITLTPHFQGLGRQIVTVDLPEDETTDTMATFDKLCGPIGPGHRREY